MTKYQKQGQINIYKKVPEKRKTFAWIWDTIVSLFWGFVILAIIGAVFGS